MYVGAHRGNKMYSDGRRKVGREVCGAHRGTAAEQVQSPPHPGLWGGQLRQTDNTSWRTKRAVGGSGVAEGRGAVRSPSARDQQSLRRGWLVGVDDADRARQRGTEGHSSSYAHEAHICGICPIGGMGTNGNILHN